MEENKPIYYFLLDEETGILTRYKITDYTRFNGYKNGYVILYKAKIGSKNKLQHRAVESSFDKPSHKRIITYNSSYKHAYKLFIKNCKQKIEDANKTIDEMSALSDRLQKNL